MDLGTAQVSKSGSCPYQHYYDDCQWCGNCGAEALCIYVSHWEDHVGKALTLELFCKECGKFTVFDWTA